MVQVTKYGLSSNDYYRLKTESKNGGIADFNSKLKNDPNQVYIVKDIGRWFNKNDYAALQWGMFVNKLGVTNPDSLILLYKEIHGYSIAESTLKALRISIENK